MDPRQMPFYHPPFMPMHYVLDKPIIVYNNPPPQNSQNNSKDNN